MESFVDQIDLAGVGIDEIVTISEYHESWDYSAYKFEEDVWKSANHGGGGGG